MTKTTMPFGPRPPQESGTLRDPADLCQRFGATPGLRVARPDVTGQVPAGTGIDSRDREALTHLAADLKEAAAFRRAELQRRRVLVLTGVGGFLLGLAAAPALMWLAAYVTHGGPK